MDSRKKIVIVEQTDGRVLLAHLYGDMCDHKIGDILNHELCPSGRIIAELRHTDTLLFDALNLVSGKTCLMIERLMNMARSKP